MNGPARSLDEPPSGPASKPVYFFDITGIRQGLPEGSDRSQAAIDRLLAPYIDSLLGPNDVRVASEDGYFVLFADLDSAQAQSRAEDLANSILSKTFGSMRAQPQRMEQFWRASSMRAASDALRRVARAAARAATEQKTAQGTAEQRDAPAAAPLDSALEHVRNGRKFVFSPMWDASAERVAGHLCHQRANVISYAVSNRTAQCEFDLASLDAACNAARELAGNQGVALIRVPVHLETLAWSKQRDAYLQAASLLNRNLLGLIAFEIVGFLEGSSATQVSQAVATLKRHAKRIFLRMPSTNPDSAVAGVMGVAALGFVAPGGTGDLRASLAALNALAGRLRRLCARQGAIAYIDRIDSIDALEVARAAGIRLVTGDILPPAVESPEALHPLSFEDIARSARGASVMLG